MTAEDICRRVSWWSLASIRESLAKLVIDGKCVEERDEFGRAVFRRTDLP